MPLPQVRAAALDAILEDIRHRPELGGALGGHGLRGGASATSAASHKRDLNGVILRGVTGAGDVAGQRGPGQRGAGGLEEFTTGGATWVCEAGGVHCA